MAHNYIVTASKPSAVTSCLTGSFTQANQLDLILIKGNILEIFRVAPEGLKPLKEVSINGKIEAGKLFRRKGNTCDSLFLITQKLDVMIIEAKIVDGNVDLVTKAHGNAADRIGKPSEGGVIVLIDPEARCIGLRLYDGLLKIIPLEKDLLDSEKILITAYNIRLDELQVIDINFLYGYTNPTIALIHQNMHGRHVKTHEISLSEKEVAKSPWKQDNVETEACMIIPVPEPISGAIIVGQESITYHSGITYVAVAPSILKQAPVCCFAPVDETRFLLGTLAGKLLMLLLDKEERMDGTFNVRDLKVEELGEISIPSALTYLDNGVVFVGSHLGDSQIVRLTTEPNDQGTFVTILESFTSLAPILDMVVVDSEKQGQSRLVTCSGAQKEGSLRIIRNGIGINEIAAIDMSGIRGLWSLKLGQVDQFQNCLVLSFVGSTQFLDISNEEAEDFDSIDLATDEETIYCSNTSSSAVLQVTTVGLRTFDQLTRKIISEWLPPSSDPITAVAGNMEQVVAAVGRYLFYFEVKPEGALLMGQKELEHDIACLDVTPIRDMKEKSDWVAVGLWTDISVRLLSLPNLVEACREPLGLDIIPRSVLMTTLEETPHLFVAMGDGTLLYYVFDPLLPGLGERKKVNIGTKPLILKCFQSKSSRNVFGCSNHPSIIYSSNRKLVFANVNFKDVLHICSLHAELYPHSLALCTEAGITIGTIDEIQKLHVRTVPMGESVRRIAYQDVTQSFAVLSYRVDTVDSSGAVISRPSASTRAQNFSTSHATKGTSIPSTATVTQEPGSEIETHSLLILDQHTFEVIHSHQLLNSEYGTSLTSAYLGEDPHPYYIVGTAFVLPEDTEPKSGRLLLFQYNDGKLTEVAEKELKGACYSVHGFNKKILAAINSIVRLYEWTPEKELRLECSHFNNILALNLKHKGDFVVVADLMRSITVLQHKIMEGSFDEIARDYNPNWMSAVEIIDDDTFLGAENTGNFFVCQKESSATTEEDRKQLQTIAKFHLGSFVNVIRHGSLAIHYGAQDTTVLPHKGILYGTIDGAIGIIVQLGSDIFGLLKDLQQRMVKTVKPLGKIDHGSWRNFYTERRTEPAEGFIDGDLIEQFLDLPKSKIIELTKELFIDEGQGRKRSLSTEDVIKLVEDLTRIH
ncbi:DNA damage-binding protein 1-like [Artemia franciscana]|uniref:DNA damage-binding protein 1 n=2 Tax=Artemia franciscana TaxID=6661 RepID=A0AA88I9D8_ARTSF|nr:hypothetical protein QYM36_002794 [Artemia franciscana]KAK2722378.1 hypothetical protein QYM36_002794 [Artemia franciscana]